MRFLWSVLVVTSLSAAPSFADAPPKRATPEGRAAWERYSVVLLKRLFPDRAAAFDGRPIVIVDAGPAPSADRTGNFVVITFSLVEVADDDAEYAAVLAHEFAHFFLLHEDTRLWSDLFVPAGHDMPLMEKQELEADAESLAALRRAGFDPCAAARMLTKFVDGYRMRERAATNPYCAMVLRREATLISRCSGT